MHPGTKDLIEVAKKLGFSGPTATGSGHYRMEHVNGPVIIPATPSDHRGRANSIAQMERIAGKKLERVNARRSRKSMKPSGFSMGLAKREQAKFRRDNPNAAAPATPGSAKAKEAREHLDFLLRDLARLSQDIEATRAHEIGSPEHLLHNELAIRIVAREQEIAAIIRSRPSLKGHVVAKLNRGHS